MNDDTEYLRLADAAKHLGNISHQTLRRLHRLGTGPARTRVGGKIIVYKRSDLDAWMASRAEGSATTTNS